MKLARLGILLFLFLLLTTAVDAQSLQFKKDGNTDFSYAQKVEVGSLPSYILGRTARDGIVQDMYVFEITEVQNNMIVELLVPKESMYQNYHPVFVLLEKGRYGGGINLPFFPPPNYNVQLIEKKGEWGQYADPLLKRTYYQGPTIRKTFSKGNYFLVVYDPGRSRGEYVLRIGSEKPFTIPWLLSHFISYIKGKFSLY